MSSRLRVAAIIVEDERVLLVSTKRGRPGYFVPPGGGVESGETLAAAVAREVAEEAALTVAPGRLLAYRELLTDKGLAVELYFGAQLAPGSAPASEEGRTVRWVPLAELGAVPHYPEQLAELCAHAANPHAGAVFLDSADLRAPGEKERAPDA